MIHRVLTLLLSSCALMLFCSAAVASPKGGTVTYTVTPAVVENSKNARVWLPYPLSNESQDISDVKISGNYSESGVYRDAKSGAVFFYAGWTDLKAKPSLVMSFHTTPHFTKGDELKSSREPVPADIRAAYLNSAEDEPLEYFKQVAARITKDKKGVLEKARAVYDWTIANTFRDPNVKGCGLGQPGRTMSECQGGGKCADISSVFVTLARAAGVPARDVYGLRVAQPKNGEITGEFHCWAEFYLPGKGWVMADPADVRKMMLVNKLELKDQDTRKWREFFWNGDDLFRIVLNKGSGDVRLTPAQDGPAPGYFMYPFGQVDGETLNYFAPGDFAYKVDLKLDE